MSIAAPAQQARTRPRIDTGTLVPIALTVFAAAIRFWRLGHQSFWYDESFTVVLVHHGYAAMLRLLPRTELTPPLYFTLVWLWAHVFGSGEVALRSLSALFGVATVPVLYLSARRLAGTRVALITGALAACNPLLIWYSQEARSYALLVLTGALSLLAFAHAAQPHAGWRRFGLWALAGTATLATHYFGAMAVAPEAAWLLWVHRFDRRLLAALGALAAVEAALAPLALTQRRQATWIAPWSLAGRLGQIPWQFVVGTGAPARVVLEVVGFAVVALAAWLVVARGDQVVRLVAALCAGLALSAVVLALVLAALGSDELITRNVIVALGPSLIAVACGLGAPRARTLGVLGAGALCAIGVTAAVGVSATSALERPDWRGLARAIAADGPPPAGRAILMENYSFLLPLATYFPHLRTIRQPGAPASELDVIAMRRASGWFCWWGATCNLQPSVLHPRFRVTGFVPVGAVIRVGPFTLQRLRARAPVRVTPKLVRAAAVQARMSLRYSLMQTPSG